MATVTGHTDKLIAKTLSGCVVDSVLELHLDKVFHADLGNIVNNVPARPITRGQSLRVSVDKSNSMAGQQDQCSVVCIVYLLVVKQTCRLSCLGGHSSSTRYHASVVECLELLAVRLRLPHSLSAELASSEQFAGVVVGLVQLVHGAKRHLAQQHAADGVVATHSAVVGALGHLTHTDTHNTQTHITHSQHGQPQSDAMR